MRVPTLSPRTAATCGLWTLVALGARGEPLRAQGTSASIVQGMVIEAQTGGAVAGATVDLRAKSATWHRSARTDERGHVRGKFRQEFEIWRGNEPLVVERSALRGGSALLDEAFGYAKFRVYGNLFAVPAAGTSLTALVGSLREELPQADSLSFAITLLGDVLVVRTLGARVEVVRRVLVDAWQRLRPHVIGREPHTPRIWAT